MGSLYDSDLVAWSAEQARMIREAGRQRVNAPIDWDNVAEEIESLGNSPRPTEVPDMIEGEMASTRTLVRNIMADFWGNSRQPLDAITYDQAAVLGDWMPERLPSPT